MRNILFILFCCTVGNSLLAATSCFLEKDRPEFINPDLPRIYADSAENPDYDLDICNHSPVPLADLNLLTFLWGAVHGCPDYKTPLVRLKKCFLFTFSGSSPPLMS
ncbi:MAG: hypothetical protein H6618_07760 [Deltaproteobacteria bacterium]|nr:hypothetical protein [Deltaproteobacteria bacterium]